MLAKNELLEDIVESLGNAPPIDGQVMHNFFGIDLVQYGLYDLQRLSSLLSEVWLATRLREVQQATNSKLIINPIPNGVEVSPYKYDYYGQNLTVHNHNHRSYPVQEFDVICLVDDLPVVFEIKLGMYKSNGVKTANTRVSGLMRDSSVKQKLGPVRHFYRNSAIGYVLVIYPEQITRHSPIQRAFTENGGHIIPFYTDQHTYTTFEVPSLIREYAIPIYD